LKSRSGEQPPAEGLKPEDRQLWQEISATLKPLKSRRAMKPSPVDTGVREERLAEDFAKGRALAGPPGSPLAGGLPLRPAASPSRRIDETTARKLQRGRVTIDARIDLHGRTEAQAHDALLRFFSACVARRQRLVLVITGKGQQSGGLLRRSVPRWFEEPAFRELVSAYRTAGPAHGGEGALYVRLRNPVRAGAGRK
jgi:DNA-nicking Smr family endonuclease